MRPAVSPLFAALAAAAMLSACATPSPDGGLSPVAASIKAGTGKDIIKITDEAGAVSAASRVDQLLKRGLNAESAVQIALLNNRALQAAYNDLGISEAQFIQASLPPNPTISLSRLAGRGIVEIERQILVNLLALLTLPARKEIAEARFGQAQLKAVEETLRTAHEARRAFIRAAASRQSAAYLTEAGSAARTVSELFKKLGETGAVNKLDQAREHVFYAEITALLARARLEHGADRERLVRALGLWGRQAGISVPARLPPLQAPKTMPMIERDAVAKRIDLEMARRELDITAKSLGLVEATRFINVVEIAGHQMTERSKKLNAETGEVEREKRSLRGIEIELQIPIFDFGQARAAEARETYLRAANRLIDRAVIVRSEAREAYGRAHGAYKIARHYQTQILPLRKIIGDESLLRYNAMIVDILPVLAEARQRIAANIAAIEARRDYSLAAADLRAAVIGGGMAGGGGGGSTSAPPGGGNPEH